MFELQDSKGNRFVITDVSTYSDGFTITGANPAYIKHRLRYCNGAQLLEAYRLYTPQIQTVTQKPIAQHDKTSNIFNLSRAKLPTATRSSIQRLSREDQLINAIAHGALQLRQTYTVKAFDLNGAEQNLGLARARVASDLNAITLSQQNLAAKSKTQTAPWGANSQFQSGYAGNAIISKHFQRFLASQPQTLKTGGAAQSLEAENTDRAQIYAREVTQALGFNPNKVSTNHYHQALQRLNALWRDKGLSKTLSNFADNYTGTRATPQTHFELGLTLLLSHNQSISSLNSPTESQVQLFNQFERAGTGFWESAEASQDIAEERTKFQGKNSAASFNDLAANDAPVRTNNAPPPAITFIEIKLLDDQGKPVANEPYTIVDPEGKEHKGNLDGDGFARIDGIRSGNCQVSFPKIEGGGVHQCSTGVDCCTPAENKAAAGSSAKPSTSSNASKTQTEPKPNDASKDDDVKNFINANYFYADGTGVAAKYTVLKQGTTQVVAEGTLPASGQAKIPLPADIDNVEVKFHSDPVTLNILKTSTPQTVATPDGWFDRMQAGVVSAWETTTDGLDWAWGVVQGDFNENPSAAQVITNAVITMIPVVDQVADARDIVANIKLLVWDKKYTEVAVWFALFITLIGLIPVVGSALKGVLKLVWKGSKLGEVLKVFNYFMKGNGVKWLKELQAGKLSEYAKQAAQTGHQVFDVIKGKITELENLIPKSFTSAHQQIKEILSTLQTVKSKINQQFDNIAKMLGDKIGTMLKEAGETTGEKAAAKGSVSKTQEALPPPKDTPTKITGEPNLSTKTTKVNKRPREIVESLSATEKEQIKKVSTFEPQGISKSAALKHITTEDGKAMLKSLKDADPVASDKVIMDRAINLLRTGNTPAKAIEINEPLYKLVPEGTNVTPYSPFFATKSEIEKAKTSGRPYSDYFGLPASSDAARYDVYMIVPKSPNVKVFQSEIAPTSELGGKITTHGGGIQILVSNRSEFGAPVKTGQLADN